MEIHMIGVLQLQKSSNLSRRPRGLGQGGTAAKPGLLPSPRAAAWFDRGEPRSWFGLASTMDGEQ
jgi:hypothetical protein